MIYDNCWPSKIKPENVHYISLVRINAGNEFRSELDQYRNRFGLSLTYCLFYSTTFISGKFRQ
jgi:hypothetical protein